MASKEENASASQQIEISPSLGLPYLNNLKNNLDQELSLLQDSLQSLKVAQQKFQESGDCVENIKPEFEGKEVLVPLTGSMYVPGRVSNPNSVIINIGTGYYVEKDIAEALDYFKRKVVFVTEQMEKIQVVGLEKSKIRDALVDMIDKTMQGQMARMQAQNAAVKS